MSHAHFANEEEVASRRRTDKDNPSAGALEPAHQLASNSLHRTLKHHLTHTYAGSDLGLR
ncbi:hypothetical protein PCANC_18488 [Puccinia coronata f. sp. avenae]|uniref:Uncharacterized protein n=1 Tax=Puccinia coronata f. sp. avenae TaxID=200324 RepID=A0A2N5T1E0_9BASI|nr:hypothetical protein PCANC_18488 [Puccinia coronata f. sp. avenae]